MNESELGYGLVRGIHIHLCVVIVICTVHLVIQLVTYICSTNDSAMQFMNFRLPVDAYEFYKCLTTFIFRVWEICIWIYLKQFIRELSIQIWECLICIILLGSFNFKTGQYQFCLIRIEMIIFHINGSINN